MEIEFIVELKDFSGYFISTRGRVFSERKKDRVELKPCNINSGYKKVNLYKEGKCYNKTIHRLVCETFLKREEGKNLVDHINRNRLDNRLENLHWVNERENSVNKGISKRNTSGITGVRYRENRNCWVADISYESNKVYKTQFKTKQEAIDWRLAMEKKYYK